MLGLRPNDVAARSDGDALLQGAILAVGEFGEPEILDGPKTRGMQHRG
jgi:hypothetical protein